MIRLFRFEPASLSPRAVAKLELDLDPLSERHMVIDRYTGEVFYNGKNDVNIHYLASKYSIDNKLMIIILDDDMTYVAAIADGVKCEVIDIADIPV